MAGVPVSMPAWRKRMAWLVGVLAVALAAVAIGCGDDDDGDGGSASSGEASGGSVVEEARAKVEPLLTPPDSIEAPALSKKPEPGKKIAVLSCQLDVCKGWRDDVADAAKKLGWQAQSISFDGTPEDTVRKMTQAVNAGVDGIIINGVGRETYEVVLPQAEAKDIPIVTQYGEVDGEPEGPIISVQGRGEHFDPWTAGTGFWVIADSDGKANALSLAFPSFPISVRQRDVMSDTLRDNCPDCKVKDINVQPTDVGTNLPQTVVSEIQRDPSINYVMLQDVTMAAGLAAALREANLLDKVTVVGNNGTPEFAQSVADGEFDVMHNYSFKAAAYQVVDALARHFNGDELIDPPMLTQIFTQDNLEDTKASYWDTIPPDLFEQYEEAWQLN